VTAALRPIGSFYATFAAPGGFEPQIARGADQARAIGTIALRDACAPTGSMLRIAAASGPALNTA
jgi:hypothetical protein